MFYLLSVEPCSCSYFCGILISFWWLLSAGGSSVRFADTEAATVYCCAPSFAHDDYSECRVRSTSIKSPDACIGQGESLLLFLFELSNRIIVLILAPVGDLDVYKMGPCWISGEAFPTSWQESPVD